MMPSEGGLDYSKGNNMATLQDLVERLRKQFQQPVQNLQAWGQVARSPQLRQEYTRQVVQPRIRRMEQSPYGQFARRVQQAPQPFTQPLKVVSQLRRIPEPSRRVMPWTPAQMMAKSYGESAETLSSPRKFMKAPTSEKLFALADVADFIPPMMIAGKIAKTGKPLAKIVGKGRTAKQASKILSEAGQRQKALRKVRGAGQVPVQGRPLKNIIPPKARAVITEPTQKTLGKITKRIEQARLKTEKQILNEWQASYRADTLTSRQKINQATQMMKQASDESIRAKLSEKADKIFMINFRTPEIIFKKLGIYDEAYVPLRKGQEAMSKELTGGITKLNEWHKRVGRGSSQRIFDYLDGVDAKLDKNELKVAGEIQIYLKQWADKLGLPEDRRIANYITHIFEPDFVGGKRVFPPEIARILDYVTPNKVFNPFLEQRIGAKGYKRDVFEALDAYIRRGARKLHLDKPTANLAKYADFEGPQAQRYLDSYLKNLAGRPDWMEKWVNDNIVSALPTGIRQRLGNRPFMRIVNTIRGQVYRGTLGLNVGSSIKNLSQNLNTFAEIGPRRVAGGLFDLLRNGTDELVQNRVLDDVIYAEHMARTPRGVIRRMDSVLFYFFDTAERINRGIGYYGAKADGLAKGMNEAQAIDYAKGIVRKTQFAYGKLDMPLALQSSGGRLGFQFGSYPIKQAELLGGYVKNKEIMKLSRYIVGTIGLTLMGAEALGIDFKEMYNIFPSLGPVPDIGMDVAGAMRGDWRSRRDLAKSPFLFIPGGTQARKTIEASRMLQKGYSETPSGKVRFLAPEGLPRQAQAMTLGQWVTPQAKEYIKGGFQPLSEKESELIKTIPGRKELFGKITASREEKAKIKEAKADIEKANKGSKTIGDRFLYWDEKAGKAKEVSVVEREKSLKDARYSLKVDRLKRADNYKEWRKATIEQIEFLMDYQSKLDPVHDEASVIKIQNKIEDLIAQVEKYDSYGGAFKKPKKPKKPPKITVKAAKVSPVKVGKSSTNKATAVTFKIAKPPKIRIKVLREKRVKIPKAKKAKVKYEKPKLIRARITS
jgi:hypothetical protein